MASGLHVLIMAPRLLIVAYGNPLRSDDGVAWRVAAELQKKLPPDQAEILTLHQLGPELAENASRSECVIFVDAAAGPGRPGEILLIEISESDSGHETSAFCHAMSPSHVLALAAELYQCRPRGFAITVVGANFNHGESLSPAVEAALPVLLARVEELSTKRCSGK
jgi:hydrogenase maturation protease